MASERISLSRVPVIGVFLLVCITFAGAQTTDPKPKPTGSISGRVTVSGKSAVGIPVAAIAGETINRRDAAGRGVTDSQGYYQIFGLPPGPYQIWTLTPGMIAEPGSVPSYFSHSGSVKSIILGANEDVQNVDLKLIRGSVITGRVTNADNKPVVQERVSVQMVDQNGTARFGSPGSPNDEMYQTDDRGVYRIFGLAAGRYKVSVGYDSNYGLRRGPRYQKTFYPGTIEQSKAAIVDLREADEAKNIDIKVEAPAAAYVVSGRVVDGESGLPIAKAGVRLTLVNKDAERSGAGSFGVQADERGEFNLMGASAGRYTAYATSESYGGNFYGDPVSFEVVDKDVSGIELKAIPGLSISGIVIADGMTTKDLLSQLPNLKVFARGTSAANDQYSSGGGSPIAPDGSFQVDGIRPGRVSINVFPSSVGMARPTIARIEHDGIGLNQGFDIQRSISGLRVVLTYGTGVIRGTIKFEDEDSPGDRRILVNCKREGTRDPNFAQVDARGHFVIKNLSPGTYEVTVQVAGGGTQSNPARPLPPQKQTVSVTNGSESEVTFVISSTPKPGGP